MNPDVEAIGLCAGALTTFAFVPQVVRTWRTRATDGLSVWWLVAFTLGIALWFAYGWLIGSWPVILANGLTLLLNLMLVYLKLSAPRRSAN